MTEIPFKSTDCNPIHILSTRHHINSFQLFNTSILDNIHFYSLTLISGEHNIPAFELSTFKIETYIRYKH